MQRDEPDARVVAWLAAERARLWVPAPVVSELWFGMERRAAGRKRRAMETWLRRWLREFGDRIVPFDLPAAVAHARLRAGTERVGKPRPAVDGLIAAIALARGVPVATRDADGFAWTGVGVVNPWAG